MGRVAFTAEDLLGPGEEPLGMNPGPGPAWNTFLLYRRADSIYPLVLGRII